MEKREQRQVIMRVSLYLPVLSMIIEIMKLPITPEITKVAAKIELSLGL